MYVFMYCSRCAKKSTELSSKVIELPHLDRSGQTSGYCKSDKLKDQGPDRQRQGLRLRAKVKIMTIKVKAKANDLTLKAKVKDFIRVARQVARPKT